MDYIIINITNQNYLLAGNVIRNQPLEQIISQLNQITLLL